MRFHHVLKPLSQDRVYMVVCKGVVDGFSVPAVLHQLYLLQNAELVRNCALGHAKAICDIAHAQLPVGECMQNANPGGIAEYFKQISQTVKVVLADDVFRVYMMMVMYLAYRRGIIDG